MAYEDVDWTHFV